MHSADVDIDLGRGLAHAKEWLENNVFRPGHKTNQALVYGLLYTQGILPNYTLDPAPSTTRHAPRVRSLGTVAAATRSTPARRGQAHVQGARRREDSQKAKEEPVASQPRKPCPFSSIRPVGESGGSGPSRSGARSGDCVVPGLPPEFLTSDSRVTDEVVLEPAGPARTRAAAGEGLDLSVKVGPGRTAVLALRHPSGALTFHMPVQSITRGMRGPSEVHFQITVRRRATRGLIGGVVKAIVISVTKWAADGPDKPLRLECSVRYRNGS